MKILEFTKKFPTEEKCAKYIKQCREEYGIVCPICGCKHHYWKKNRNQWECSHCGHRTTLTSGTVMENSKLPLFYWLFAIHLLTCSKTTFSASELQRQLGHKRYQPIWEMAHKLRDVMGQRDDEYTLSGEVELDEGFFSTDILENHKFEKLKRGRGSQKKTKVLVMAESTETAGGKRKDVTKKVGHIKMLEPKSFATAVARRQVPRIGLEIYLNVSKRINEIE